MLGHEREKRRGEERRGEESLVPWLEEGWWWGGIEGANVPRPGNTVSVLHPLSLRPLAYFYSSLSETWVGSSPFPLEEFFLLLLLLLPSPSLFPLLCVYTQPSGCVYLEEGDAAAATTCKHSPVLFAIRMPPKPPPVREEPPSLSTLYMYMYMCMYIYTSILLASGKISSSLLRWTKRNLRGGTYRFSPRFHRYFSRGCSFEKGEGIIVRRNFFSTRSRDWRLGGSFGNLFDLRILECEFIWDDRPAPLDRNLSPEEFFFDYLRSFGNLLGVRIRDYRIYFGIEIWFDQHLSLYFFFLELFCEESLRWRNFFEFLM